MCSYNAQLFNDNVTVGGLPLAEKGIPKTTHSSIVVECVTKSPGGRLNKKDGLTRYGDSHVKDKTS